MVSRYFFLKSRFIWILGARGDSAVSDRTQYPHRGLCQPWSRLSARTNTTDECVRLFSSYFSPLEFLSLLRALFFALTAATIGLFNGWVLYYDFFGTECWRRWIFRLRWRTLQVWTCRKASSKRREIFAAREGLRKFVKLSPPCRICCNGTKTFSMRW